MRAAVHHGLQGMVRREETAVAVRAVKESVRVILLTSTYRVEGYIHVVPGGRLLDEINKEREFIPVTKASIYAIDGEAPLDTLDFIAVNKNQVVMVAPATLG
jgi:hypothetical protein